MSERLFYFPGSPAAAVAQRLPPTCGREPVTGDATLPPGVLLVDATAPDLARAARLQAVQDALAVVALTERGDRPDAPAPRVYAWVPASAPSWALSGTLAGAFAHVELRRELQETRAKLARAARELQEMTTVGSRVAAERDTDTLLDLVLTAAREITGSDAGSLYLVETDEEGRRRLRFKLVQNDSLAVPFKESTIPISSESVAGHVALTGEPLNLEDAYALPPGSSFRIDPAFDRQVGYRTKSMLVVPMRAPAGDVLGVLQLINRKAGPARRFASPAAIEREALAFSERSLDLATSLASQAASALENARLYAELRAALGVVEESQRRIIQGERLRALGEMAGGVAHDFNNILAVIVGRAQLLLRQVADPDLRRQLEVIEQVGRDGAQTVRRIQEFARMRRTRPFQSVDLNAVVREVVETTRPRWSDEAQSRGVTYDVRVETVPVPTVVGDPAELRESLMNLLFNALDAMPEGGRVTLTTGVAGERVHCAVVDTGVGMTDEVRQRVFEPFFTTKVEQGTGLGLSIAYGIVTRHGGDIEVRSRPGEGSAFTIRLPVGRETPGAPSDAPSPRSERQARVLVIEDERPVREVLVELLARHGHAVVACADGRTGLARLEEGRFDLILVDLSMPGMSGWDVVSRVAQTSPRPSVCLITGWGDQIDQDAARQLGVDYFVAKPFDLDDVTAVVAQALARASAREG